MKKYKQFATGLEVSAKSGAGNCYKGSDCKRQLGLTLGLLFSLWARSFEVSALDPGFQPAYSLQTIARAEAEEHARIVVTFYTVAKFCDVADWSIQQGYEVIRKNLLGSGLINFGELRQVHMEAIDTTEFLLEQKDARALGKWCDDEGQKSTRFFLGVLSGADSFQWTHLDHEPLPEVVFAT